MSSFNTQPPEGGCIFPAQSKHHAEVSTRSRPKAAGRAWSGFTVRTSFQHAAARRRLADIQAAALYRRGFNTQPPEGG